MPVQPRDLATIVEDALRELGVPNDALLVAAVSGGPDSVALLHCIGQRESLQRRTVVGHVDHALRAESAAEARFVAELCHKLRIPFHSTRLTIDPGATGNLAARLREARYEFLLGLTAQGGFLLTAHHADDQAVTLLMRLLEGAALPGLAGMRQRRDDIVRPFLNVPRRHLLAYLTAHSVAFCQDPSNLDESKFRNRIRQQVWNPILEEDPEAGRRVALAANRLREDDDALQHWASSFLTQAKGAANWVEVPLTTPEIPPAVLRRVLNGVLSARWQCGPLSGEQWPGIAEELRSGGRTNLPGRITVQKTANRLVFLSQQPVLSYALDIREPGDYVLPVGLLQVGERRFGSGQAPFQIRNTQPGDRFCRQESNEPVGVQDWLKKLGVPRHKRAGWPVVPRGAEAVPVAPAFAGTIADTPSRVPYGVGADDALRFRSELSEGIQGLAELAQKL